LKAQFPNDDARLFPNQFVNVRMLIDTRRDVTTVPSAALQRGTRGLFVYIVKEDRTVTLRDVKTGPAENDATVVESGIEPGELVVVDGMDRLREGAKVELPTRDAASAGKGGDGERKKGGGRRKGGDPGAEKSGSDKAAGDKAAGDKPAGDKGAVEKDAVDRSGADKSGSAGDKTSGEKRWPQMTDAEKSERRKMRESQGGGDKGGGDGGARWKGDRDKSGAGKSGDKAAQ
jgi:multidrug efflux system membrane fusion protein